jgi:aryl-alcohol dehydrogenase-like predicted oxidoreductase
MAGRVEGTPRRLFVEAVRSAFEQLVARGRIGAWGISAIGVPTAVLETISEDPPPIAIQAVANLLDSLGAMKRFDEPARAREIIAAAEPTRLREALQDRIRQACRRSEDKL